MHRKHAWDRDRSNAMISERAKLKLDLKIPGAIVA